MLFLLLLFILLCFIKGSDFIDIKLLFDVDCLITLFGLLNLFYNDCICCYKFYIILTLFLPKTAIFFTYCWCCWLSLYIYIACFLGLSRLCVYPPNVLLLFYVNYVIGKSYLCYVYAYFCICCCIANTFYNSLFDFLSKLFSFSFNGNENYIIEPYTPP